MTRPRFALIRFCGDPRQMRTTIEFTRDKAKAREFAKTESRLLSPEEAGLPRVLCLRWFYEVRLLPKFWRPKRIRIPIGSTATPDDLLAEALRRVGKLMAPCDLSDNRDSKGWESE